MEVRLSLQNTSPKRRRGRGRGVLIEDDDGERSARDLISKSPNRDHTEGKGCEEVVAHGYKSRAEGIMFGRNAMTLRAQQGVEGKK